MAKDYSKKQNRSSSPAPSGAGRLSAILIAFVAGYLTANVFDVESVHQWLSKQWHAIQSEDGNHTHPAPQKAELPKPKFEFYTRLSKDKPSQTPLSDADAHHMAKAIKKTVTQAQALAPLPAVKKKSYRVQVASYITMKDAERMKATLIMLDLQTHIEVVKQGKSTIYRVLIGPYEKFRDAEKAQIALAHSEHITGIIRRQEA